MAEADPMEFLRQPASLANIEQTKTFDSKKWVWVPLANDEYVAGSISKVEGEIAILETSEGKEVKVKKDDLMQMNPPKFEKCEDMASLTYLNEAAVLHNLNQRYTAGLIYTYSGLFCVAINPYRRLPIYTDKVISIYRGKRRQEVPPHVFSIVDNAYQDMLIDHENQSILITGESGAGKTENTKKVIQYVAKVAGVEKKSSKAQESEGSGNKLQGDLDEQVVEANPLLEAYGNAKTTRNNNSSRFGKFIRCHFSQTGKLAGADIESYLLEKSRVVFQLSAERNYHIFYQILYAGSNELHEKLAFSTREAEKYFFLEKGCSTVDGIDDHEEFKLTEKATTVLGFTEEDQLNMYKICGGILHFGNMKFKQKPRDEQAEVADPSDGEKCSFLLGVPTTEFVKCLTKPRVKVGTEYVNKGQNVAQVTYSVGALCKALYERMFWWIVARVNKALDTKERRAYFIGVLDIAGFEIFDYNTFEQLCINLTNEKLQQFFNHHMFVLEQEEYKKEGINWEFIDFGLDLESTINLIEKPMGVFAILEEECIVPKATDKTFLEKLHKTHNGKHKSYSKPSVSSKIKGDFLIHHYAGSVPYSVEGWLEKNKDPINQSVAQLFSKASNTLVNHLFQDYNPDVTGGRRKGSAFQTVSSRHKEQLTNLLVTLGNTSPHFVRCIIPNEKKKPGLVESHLVLHQLRCNGVLEGIRICRKGFPSRMLFQDFKQRYKILAASAIPTGFVDGRVAAEKLIGALRLEENEYRIGTTKVFFRAGIVGELEDMRDERLSAIISQFQAYCKGYLMRKEYKKMLDQRIGIAVIQRNVRKYLYLRNWQWWKLFTRVKPLLKVAQAEEEMREREEELKKAQELAKTESAARQQLEEKVAEVMEDRNRLFEDLQREQERLVTVEDKLMKLQTDKDRFESQLNEALERLEDEEASGASLADEKRQLLQTKEDLENKVEEFTANVARLETEKANRDKQIDALNEDITRQDETIAKLNKDKKGLEDTIQEQMAAIQAEEDKVSHLNKVKSKLEQTLASTEASLQKEKDQKAKVEKEKRKVEQDLKSTQDTLSETEAAKRQVEDTLSKREKTISDLNNNIENDQRLIQQLQKKIQELQRRVEELEEELENERKLRQKVEKQRAELEAELEALNDRLEEQGGATAAQVEMNKKREQEIAKLRKDIEENNQAHDQSMAQMKNKFNTMLQEAGDELENVKKAKARLEKEKTAMSADIDELNGQLETVKKQKANADKQNKLMDEKLNENKTKIASLESSVSELETSRSKLQSEGGTLNTQVEELEHQIGLLTKTNKSLESQLNELKAAYEAELRAKQDAQHKLQQASGELEQLNEQMEEEQEAKNQLQAKLSRTASEAQQWKSKYEMEGTSRVDELEEAKKKLSTKVTEMEEALAAAEQKASSMEKAKNRMNGELEDLMIDLEKAQSQASALEKKQKKVDQQINEWKLKCDEVQMELEGSQRESRQYSTELLKLRTSHEELIDQLAAVKKEKKMAEDNLKAATEQLSDGGKNSLELEKMRRKMELEKEELQVALEEAEGALELEEGKVLKIQLELTQLKQEFERRMAEKDEELDNTRKNYQRQIDSLQSTVDAESRAKVDAARAKKKQEGDITELEAQLDTANRINNDQQKSIKKLQQQMKELQAMLEDEQRAKDEGRDSISRSEKRANDLAAELDELKMALEQADRARKLAENERTEFGDRVSELQAMNQALQNAKRKVEGEFHSMQEEIEELENEAKANEEKANRALAEIARMQSEAANALEAANSADKSKAAMERALREMQGRLEEAEASGGKQLKNQVRKLEQRVRDLEAALDDEGRKGNDLIKANRKAEKKYKDIVFQMEEDRKVAERAQDQVEKMAQKLKKLKSTAEEAEAQAAANLSKFKKAQAELEDAEERAEAAEQALAKARARARTTGGSASAGGLRASSRAQSGARTPRSRAPPADED